MSQIAATTTRTSTSLLARTIGAGVSGTDGTGMASHIRQRLQIPDYGGSRSGGHPLGKGKDLTLHPTQTLGAEAAEEAEEGEILEMLEEGEIPRILMKQEQHPHTPIPIE